MQIFYHDYFNHNFKTFVILAATIDILHFISFGQFWGLIFPVVGLVYYLMKNDLQGCPIRSWFIINIIWGVIGVILGLAVVIASFLIDHMLFNGMMENLFPEFVFIIIFSVFQLFISFEFFELSKLERERIMEGGLATNNGISPVYGQKADLTLAPRLILVNLACGQAAIGSKFVVLIITKRL